MSADNGIYILESDGPEYRVVHAQAIENIHWNEATRSSENSSHFNECQVRQYFGDCKVFCDKQEAYEEAYKMKEKVLSDEMCPILEYGVITIHFPGQFPVGE